MAPLASRGWRLVNYRRLLCIDFIRSLDPALAAREVECGAFLVKIAVHALVVFMSLMEMTPNNDGISCAQRLHGLPPLSSLALDCVDHTLSEELAQFTQRVYNLKVKV